MLQTCQARPETCFANDALLERCRFRRLAGILVASRLELGDTAPPEPERHGEQGRLTNQTQPTLTIGIVPRERFSIWPRALKSILDYTDLDYELIIVDNQTPPRYWAEIEQLLAGRENVRIIRTEKKLLPGPCKELIADVCDTELICLIENDVIVTEGWLTSMIDAIQEYPADVVSPMVLEGSPHKIHADKNFGHFKFVQTERGTELSIVPIAHTARELSQITSVTPIECGETHCLLFRTEALKRTKPFREPLNTREFIDTFLTLREAGVTFVFQPASRVIFVPPPPVEPDEMPFFAAKWDKQLAADSHRLILEKWNLAAFPPSIGFVTEHWYRASRVRWFFFSINTRVRRRLARELRQLFSRGRA